ncbi:MAG: aminotransferase class IV [Alphaproteobacteria bacterium]|nr:aminotransferase class IV [Alphaproteobacteria bacterium]
MPDTKPATPRANQRVAWFNGQIMPESEVRISFRDRGVKYGDGAFDTTRTFAHRIFRLKDHVDRFYRTLKYLRLDPGMGPAEMCRLTEDVLARNLHLLDKDDDYWVSQRITRGTEDIDYQSNTPNVIIECLPLPLKARAVMFRDGLKVITPAVRRAPPEVMSPRAKTHNYLNMIVADQEVRSQDPLAWAVLLDMQGNLAEGLGSNIFTVRDGELYTPRTRNVLPGVSRQTVIELAESLKIKVHEQDIDLYDAYTADEVFLTSTSLCIAPVQSVNGQSYAANGIPGPVTKRLTDAYIKLVDCDFIGQYLRRL